MHVLHNPHVLRKLFDKVSYSIPATSDRVSLHKTYITRHRSHQAEKSKGKALDKGSNRREVDYRTTNVSAGTDEGLQPGEYMQLRLIIIVDVRHIVASTSAMGINAGKFAHEVSGMYI